MRKMLSHDAQRSKGSSESNISSIYVVDSNPSSGIVEYLLILCIFCYQNIEYMIEFKLNPLMLSLDTGSVLLGSYAR